MNKDKENHLKDYYEYEARLSDLVIKNEAKPYHKERLKSVKNMIEFWETKED